MLSLRGTLASIRVTENASRMRSLLRSARADAANTGKRMRVSFDPETTQPLVSIEQDGLAQPGVFTPYQAWWVKLVDLQGGVRIVECQLAGASDFEEISAGSPGLAAQEEAELAEITFLPDGSSDSARIVLASSDEDRPWRMEVTLNGVDGSIQTRELGDEEDELAEDDELDLSRPDDGSDQASPSRGR